MNKNDVVAVVLGGPSEEREVSRNTGHAICEALKEKGVQEGETVRIRDMVFEYKDNAC